MAAPRALATGIGSPVSANSSIVAAFELTTPSTGTTSPACTRSRSPMATADIGTSSTRPSARRCASRGARSTSERKSRSARATATSSSTLPPEYISATTAPASGWPSATAALIDTSAIASTPSRPASRSRVIETANPAITGKVASVQHRSANAGRPASAAAIPAASPVIAIETSAHRIKRSNDIGAFHAHAARGLSLKSRRLPLREINCRAGWLAATSPPPPSSPHPPANSPAARAAC